CPRRRARTCHPPWCARGPPAPSTRHRLQKDRRSPATASNRADPPAGTGTVPPRAGLRSSSPAVPHVLRPRLHLVAHRRFRRAHVGAGLDHARLFGVAAEVAAERDPVTALGCEPLLALVEILKVVGI